MTDHRPDIAARMAQHFEDMHRAQERLTRRECWACRVTWISLALAVVGFWAGVGYIVIWGL